MTAIQQTFDDLSNKATRKRVAPEYARRMIALLVVKQGKWLTRADFKREINLDDRQVRAGREASNSRIVYGQDGLKLMQDLTLQEYNAYMARLYAERDAVDKRIYQAQMRYYKKNTMETIKEG